MNNKHLSYLLLLVLMLAPSAVGARTFTFGSEVEFAAVNPQSSAVARIDATRAIVAYGNSSVNKGYARIATVSGSSISFGSVYEYSSAYVSMTNVTMLDSTHAVIVYNEYYNSKTTKVIIATVSGSTLSFGSPVSISTDSNNGIGYGYGISMLDSTHFVLAYETRIIGDSELGEPDTHGGYVIAGSVSDTTITMGSAVNFTSSNPGALSVVGLDSTHFVFASGGINQVRAGSVSGTTITLGTGVAINSGSPFLGKIDSTRFLLNTVTNPERAQIGTIAGTDITLGSAVSYASTLISYGATAVMDSTQALLIYRDHAISATMSGTTVTTGTAVSYASNSLQHFATALSTGTVIVGYTGSNNKGYLIAAVDVTAPSVPGSFSASATSSNAALTWTNPIDSDFSSVVIRRSMSSYPASVSEGAAVTTSSGESYTDSGLTDAMYFYSIFAYDTTGNYSTAANATVTINTAVTANVDSAAPQQSGGGGRGGSTAAVARALQQRATTTPSAHPAATTTTTSSPSPVSISPTSTPALSVLTSVRVRLEERVQKQIAAKPSLAPMLKKMLARMEARIAKSLSRVSRK